MLPLRSLAVYFSRLTIGWTGALGWMVAATGGMAVGAPADGEIVYEFKIFAGGTRGAADGVGAAAQFGELMDLATDRAGNVFVADWTGASIRKITPDGTVTTFAGGWGRRPNGLGIDAADNLYVTDSDSIRKVSPAGQMTTFYTHSQYWQPHDVAVDSGGSVVVSDGWNGALRKFTSTGEIAGQTAIPPSSGSGVFLQALVFDGSDNRYFRSDGVEKVSATGTTTQLLSSNHIGRLGGIAIDGGGTIFLADSSARTVMKVDARGVRTIVAGGGYGISEGRGAAAKFTSPVGIAIDGSGNIYVAEGFMGLVWKGTPSVSAFTTQPQGGEAMMGEALALSGSGYAEGTVRYEWRMNGVVLAGGSTATLTLADIQPRDAGVYTMALNNGAVVTSQPAIVGVLIPEKVAGRATEVGADILHANGNVYDQVLLEGAAGGIKNDPGQITRLSYLDMDGDIVQVEFSGAGTLSIVLANPKGPAPAANYNQPAVSYVMGHAGIVIAGADETTNVSVFSVGSSTAVNQALFKANYPYDGIADLAYIAIRSANGKFGGVRAANANFYATAGVAGIYAPGVEFTGPVYVGEITAYLDTVPSLVLGAGNDVRIAGGSLQQENTQPVRISGFNQIRFVDGSTSHGRELSAQPSNALFVRDGVDVTDEIMVLP